MGIAHLYALDKNERKQLYQAMAENFMEDDLYVQIFPDRAFRRKFLPFYFRQYLAVLMRESYVLADSEEKNSVMVLYDSKLAALPVDIFLLCKMNLWLFAWFVVHGKWKELHAMVQCRQMFTSTWTKRFVQKEAYFHLDLLYTRKEKRGQGFGSLLLACACDAADRRGCSMTMETHHQDNLHLYKAFGFVEVMTIAQKAYGLNEYCLLRKRKKER